MNVFFGLNAEQWQEAADKGDWPTSPAFGGRKLDDNMVRRGIAAMLRVLDDASRL